MFATLAINDLQQRLVRSIEGDVSLNPGTHRFDAQMAAIPPGIYIVQLRTENAIIQRRLVKL